MTVGEWLTYARTTLAGHGVDSPLLEAQVLAAHVLLVDRAWLFAHADADFPELAGESLLQRRLASEPLAYIIGSREFYGRRFQVGPGVLVPRQETELLVDVALDFLKARPRGCSVLDVGTGSGCIAISVQLEAPQSKVTGVDISERALEWANRNSEELRAEVTWKLSDLFDSLGEEVYDLIVSNPPYIGMEEHLPEEVRNFEPASALFAEESGLAIYRRMAEQGATHLAVGGMMALEVGYTQARAVEDVFAQSGWQTFETLKDLSGIERVVVFQRR